MKCKSPFSENKKRKKRKNIIRLTSAEFACLQAYAASMSDQKPASEGAIDRHISLLDTSAQCSCYLQICPKTGSFKQT